MENSAQQSVAVLTTHRRPVLYSAFRHPRGVDCEITAAPQTSTEPEYQLTEARRGPKNLSAKPGHLLLLCCDLLDLTRRSHSAQ